MTQLEFFKIPIGSTVNLINFPQLEGKIVGKDGYMAIVDFPPNNITHSDPEPRPIHYANLGIVSYASVPVPEVVIPERIKNGIKQLLGLAEEINEILVMLKNDYKL